MTDKEVIIDGVNVAGCEHCTRVCQNTKEPQAICELYRYCTNNPNCCYKQFQRLQAENEELKKELINGGGTLTDKIRAEVFTDLQNENDRYKQALEKIKERISTIDTYMIMVNNANIPSYVKVNSYNAQENINIIIDVINEVLKDESTQI